MKQKSKRTLTPKLRFPEFRDKPGWEEKPLGACLDYQQPTPYLVSDTNYGPAFNTPVLTAGKTFILGYTSEKHGIFSEDLPVIIFDDFTTVTQFVDFPFKAKSSAMKILQAKNGANIKFMFEILQTLSYEVGAHERHWISIFSPMLVPVPKPPEQQKIAECLGSLDGLIAAEGRKLAALRDHKRGLMQQLFPQPGQTQPRLRFPEFRKGREWKSVKLSKVFEEYRDKSTVQDQYEVLTSARSGLIRQKDYYGEGRITGRDNVGFNIIPPNYITYRSRADDRRFYFNENDLGITGIISTYYPVFRVVDGSNKFFIELLAHYQAAVGKYSVGTSQTVLSLPMLGRVKLPLPTPAEQQKIADCLTALDSLINAQAAKIDALKIHKRGLMQQLFPAPEEQ